MRTLLLLRGAPGCGKSTFIKENNLSEYALSPDTIRLMMSSPELDTNGKYRISQKNNEKVFKLLYELLENRMSNGDFTVIDATFSKLSEYKTIKNLSAKYRYRVYCKDFTDLPIDICKDRNSKREEYKVVSDSVIEEMYNRYKINPLPSWIKTISDLNELNYNSTDYSGYNAVNVIGDIHGCYTALTELINNVDGIKDEELYIFTGDYTDRGIENVKTLKYLMSLSEKPNVLFLEGNHERWVSSWANDDISYKKSKTFTDFTMPELKASDISLTDLRRFYKRLAQCVYIKYGTETFFICHGGISNLTNKIIDIPTEQLIKGVGKYEDMVSVDNTFKQINPNLYQIHGHRNIQHKECKINDRCYCLESQVEFGGNLRAVRITKNENDCPKVEIVEVKNNVYKTLEELNLKKIDIPTVTDKSVADVIDEMRNDNCIREKSFGRISSFNFTRNAFEKGCWSERTMTARGLYIDTIDKKVVARSYNKFFNIGEQDNDIDSLRDKLCFPVTVYRKENGFLGIVGYDEFNDQLIITSKSAIDGPFAEYFRNVLLEKTTEEKLKEIIKKNNSSLVFECIDIDNDPHIIKYKQNNVILLDIIKNELTFSKLSYDELQKSAEYLGVDCKIFEGKIETFDELESFISYTNNPDIHIEGYVLEDVNGYMFKLKTFYYRFWKKMRGLVPRILKGKYDVTSADTISEEEFALFAIDNKEILHDTSIIDLRELYYESVNKCNV